MGDGSIWCGSDILFCSMYKWQLKLVWRYWMPEQGVPLTASFIPLQSQKAPLFYTSFLQDHLFEVVYWNVLRCLCWAPWGLDCHHLWSVVRVSLDCILGRVVGDQRSCWPRSENAYSYEMLLTVFVFYFRARLVKMETQVLLDHRYILWGLLN